MNLLRCDILIEAVVEEEAAKRNLISSLAEMGYRKLFVSNTSSISITRLASSYPLPEKFMGMHFMNPVPIQPGCELIRGFLTSEETFQKILEFSRELGKEPILAEDKAGFGINRMFVPFLNEAVKVVEEGIMSCEDADKTIICLGHKMGPITTLDYVGLDTTLAIAQVLERELGPGLQGIGPAVQTCCRRILRDQKWPGFLLVGARKESRREPRRATLPAEVNVNRVGVNMLT